MRCAGVFQLPVPFLAVALTLTGTGATTAGASAPPAPGAPTFLTVDDDPSPLWITDDPAFGWRVNDAARGARQSAYEIVVRDGAGNQITDTGKVMSPQQSYVHVPNLLTQLQPDRSYSWTVRTWNARGQAASYAPPAHFDVALHDGDWLAQWIRRPGAERAGLEDYSLFRKDVRVGASPIVRARVYASAGHQYELRVNGAWLAHGPSFAYPDEQYYETTDVTSALHAGTTNTFAFTTWWGQPGQGRPASVPALIARITIDHADGSREILTTDNTWQTHAGARVQGPPRNDEGDFVEHVDERQLPPGWDRPGFDATGWAPAAVLGPHPTAPFAHLFAARTHIVQQRTKPVRLTRLADGAYVADFGAVISATPVVAVHHGAAGAHVVLTGGYLLDPNGHVSRTRGIQETNMTWQFDERAGPQELRPFGYLAFRYLEVAGTREQLTTDDVQIDARHANLPDENAARFQTSNSTLDAVWNLARHSALFDSQEQFLDTPTREKGPFLGDSADVSQATMAAFGERELTYQALRDFARSQARYWTGEGRVNVVYPNGDGKRDIPDGTQTYAQWVWRAYTNTGDREQLAAVYPVVHNITDYVARAIDPKTGLVTRLPGGGSDYQYGAVDWPPQMRYGYDMNTAARTMTNVQAVDDFRRAAAMARALGRPASEIAELDHRADALAAAIRAKLTRPDGVLIDGLEPDGTQSKHASQQANAWALAYGIVPAGNVEHVSDYVVSLGTQMGVVYFRVLLDALHEAGRDDALVTTLTDPNRPGYAQMLREGATFTWESWDARQTGDSESHGWGSTVLAVLQDDVLGVRTDAPGAEHLDVRVPATSLTRAAGTITTQRGPVPVSWTRDSSGHETLDVAIPANARATVHLPAADTAHVSESAAPLTGDPGITGVRAHAGVVDVDVGAGHYVFANTAPTRASIASTSSSSSSAAPLVATGATVVLLAVAAGGFLLWRRRRAA